MFDAPGIIETPAADRVCQLRTAELLLLAASRLWVAAYLDAAWRGPDWRNGFAAAGLNPGTAADLDALFGRFSAGATREIGFHRPACGCLGEDENMLLAAFSHLQRGRQREARELLCRFLAPAALRIALALAADVARAMGQAGLELPERRAASQPFLGIYIPDHGLNLVH